MNALTEFRPHEQTWSFSHPAPLESRHCITRLYEEGAPLDYLLQKAQRDLSMSKVRVRRLLFGLPKLRPCPFCKGEELTWVKVEGKTAPKCSCGAQGPLRDCRVDATADWNRRRS